MLSVFISRSIVSTGTSFLYIPSIFFLNYLLFCVAFVKLVLPERDGIRDKHIKGWEAKTRSLTSLLAGSSLGNAVIEVYAFH